MSGCHIVRSDQSGSDEKTYVQSDEADENGMFRLCIDGLQPNVTYKRLYGYVGDSHKPRVQTLDTLATYLEFKDYAGFVDWLKTSTRYNSSFFDAGQLVSSDLEPGECVEIGWSPNRVLRLEYLGDSTYRVLESRNSKILADDIFVTGCFIKKSPLFLPYIERNGERTASFVAGRNGGLSIVKKINA